MSEIDKFIEKSKWPCGKLICVEPEYIGKFGCHGCRLNFTETRPFRQHCTQCEIGQQNLELIAEVERLKGEKQIILNRIKKFMADRYAEREKDFDKGCALAYAVCVLELERTPEELQKLLDNEVAK